MRSLASLIALALALMATIMAGAASNEFANVPLSKSPTNRLLKRSFCNTFGGCGGSKRSIDSPQYSTYRLNDESSDEPKLDIDPKMVSEILEDITEHLKRNRNYRPDKYVVFATKPTSMDSAQ